MPVVLAPLGREDSIINVHDSWLLPPPDGSGRVNLRSMLPLSAPAVLSAADGSGRASIRSLVPREPDPFTIHPPQFSLPPRS